MRWCLWYFWRMFRGTENSGSGPAKTGSQDSNTSSKPEKTASSHIKHMYAMYVITGACRDPHPSYLDHFIIIIPASTLKGYHKLGGSKSECQHQAQQAHPRTAAPPHHGPGAAQPRAGDG